MSFNRILALVCAASVLSACGKSSPAGPTPSGPAANTYVAELNLGGGVTGTLTLRASGSLASLERPGVSVLSRLLAWVEPAVAAQSSTATGLLVTSSGEVISLTGTFSGGTFNVSGFGYSIVATVTSTSTGTSISGTATLPGGGTTTVAPPPPLPVTGPPPANPVGTYAGTFHIQTTMSMENRRVSDSSLELNCTFSVTIDGTLSLRLFNVLENGMTQSELTSGYTENRVPVSCKLGNVQLAAVPPSVSSENASPPGVGVWGFEGPASSLTFGWVSQGSNNAGQGVITDVASFVGAVSGSTVVMSVSRSHKFVNAFTSVTSGPITSVFVYPTVSVTTTLTKQ